jgi:ABC-type microcin C transport system permease subunit YejE
MHFLLILIAVILIPQKKYQAVLIMKFLAMYCMSYSWLKVQKFIVAENLDSRTCSYLN